MGGRLVKAGVQGSPQAEQGGGFGAAEKAVRAALLDQEEVTGELAEAPVCDLADGHFAEDLAEAEPGLSRAEIDGRSRAVLAFEVAHQVQGGGPVPMGQFGVDACQRLRIRRRRGVRALRGGGETSRQEDQGRQ